VRAMSSTAQLVDRVLAAAHERLQQRCDRDKIMISVGGGVGQPADFCPGQGNLARIQRVISIC
jgi:hypothetical protein